MQYNYYLYEFVYEYVGPHVKTITPKYVHSIDTWVLLERITVYGGK